MEPARNIEEYNANIAAIREASHKRRAAAWAQVPETVLGIELNPLTPAIHSLLVGTGNAYVTGAVPKEADLRNFIWFCSPYFNPDRPILSLRWKPWQMWKLRKALVTRTTSRNRQQTIVWNFYKACLQIHQLIADTFKDGVPYSAGDEEYQPLAASLEAQVVDMFAREYRVWPLSQPVRHTPIKQLYQLARCIDRRNIGKENKYYDPDENECTRLFLQRINQRN